MSRRNFFFCRSLFIYPCVNCLALELDLSLKGSALSAEVWPSLQDRHGKHFALIFTDFAVSSRDCQRHPSWYLISPSHQSNPPDGRRWNELRHHSYQTAVQSSASGSSLVSHGNTTIICTVNGPREPPPSSRARVQADRAVIDVDFTICAFSTLERKKRSKNERYCQCD